MAGQPAANLTCWRGGRYTVSSVAYLPTFPSLGNQREINTSRLEETLVEFPRLDEENNIKQSEKARKKNINRNKRRTADGNRKLLSPFSTSFLFFFSIKNIKRGQRNKQRSHLKDEGAARLTNTSRFHRVPLIEKLGESCVNTGCQRRENWNSFTWIHRFTTEPIARAMETPAGVCVTWLIRCLAKVSDGQSPC